MNNAASQKGQSADIGSQVTLAMRTMGVAPIPRNYELFYEAYIGSNPALTRELASLGNKATQQELDVIGAQYFGQHHRTAMIDGVHTKVSSQLENLMTMLKEEQDTLESYNRVLIETANRINSKTAASTDLLRNAIGILSSATGETVGKGEKMVENVVQKSQEMDIVRQELEEYKRIANTDSLTRLSNRRAFDDKLIAIYDNMRNRNTTTLILADIDHFKKINDSYGHPVGDKILATVATVIKANVRKDIFVARTGGEEFAIIIEGNSEAEAAQVAERIRRSLEATPFKNSKTGVNYGPVTISLGLCVAGAADDPNDLYSKADIALYSAKNSGRNKSLVYEDGMKKESAKNWLIYKK